MTDIEAQHIITELCPLSWLLSEFNQLSTETNVFSFIFVSLGKLPTYAIQYESSICVRALDSDTYCDKLQSGKRFQYKQVSCHGNVQFFFCLIYLKDGIDGSFWEVAWSFQSTDEHVDRHMLVAFQC